MKTFLSVSLPEKLAAELDAIAKETGRNKSDVVKESLGLFLWETKFRNLKKKLSVKAKGARVVSEEDVLKAQYVARQSQTHRRPPSFVKEVHR